VSAALRVIVVDDEPLARARLRRLLADTPEVEVVAECSDGEAARRAIADQPADLVLLDIEMPGSGGFGVLDAVGAEAMPAVVFVTAHAEHAVRAFDVRAVDYLLKPVRAERLAEALARVRSRRAAAPPVMSERLAIRDGSRVTFVAVDDLELVCAAGNYVELRAGTRTFLMRETLSGLEQRLDPERFLRIHRRTIVRLDRVVAIEPAGASGEYVLSLRSGARVSSGRSHRGRLLAALGLLRGGR
jgi:two-component system LytT family response regulator